ncbi:MAG TPA: viral A-type inclusion protein [Chitinophagaceae bacterium]|nr:viral A-type inclusion protein [Chitinophagaceae bacterium]
MKRILIPAVFFSMVLFVACNNSSENAETKENKPLTAADSLMNEVMEGHDAVMPKMGKVRGAQKQAQQMLDSLSKLPAKAQQAVSELKEKLQSLVNDLNYADYAMDTWMTEFKMDSAKEDMKTRIKYLTDEKMKVNKVKDAVLNSLAKADSILQRN